MAKISMSFGQPICRKYLKVLPQFYNYKLQEYLPPTKPSEENSKIIDCG